MANELTPEAIQEIEEAFSAEDCVGHKEVFALVHLIRETQRRAQAFCDVLRERFGHIPMLSLDNSDTLPELKALREILPK